MYTPTADRVLFERDEPKDTIGGIYVPSLRQEPSLYATVRAIGPKVTILKPGNRIMVAYNVGYPLPGLGMVCREEDVLAIVVTQ